MLEGNFKNCYGLVDFQLRSIPYSTDCNSAVIYAPNGVMKSSLARVFEDAFKKVKTKDRIFPELKTEYSFSYYGVKYDQTAKKAADNIYVIHSFDEKFESSPDSVSTILADDEIRKEYESIIKSSQSEINGITNSLVALSDVPVKSIQSFIALDFGLNDDADWFSIIECLATNASTYLRDGILDEVRYSIVFNPQTERIFENPAFMQYLGEYITIFQSLIMESHFLSSSFNDHNVAEFSKSLEKNNIFAAKHKIVTQSGEVIEDYIAWKVLVDKEFQRIYDTPELSAAFLPISKLLNANEAARTLKDLLLSNRQIITYLNDRQSLRKHLWLNYLYKENVDVVQLNATMDLHKQKLNELSAKAKTQLEHWVKVVEEFKDRFRAPFEVSISNESQVLFSGEPARLIFTYVRGTERREKSKDELMSCLSVGEKRALYLLQILFDLEKIKSRLKATGKKHLIIADDIADSFDYSNKYAIIEYLRELVDEPFIDLLILTHNFDFYRTVSSRLNIKHECCFAVHKLDSMKLEMVPFSYRKDFFKSGLLSRIKDGKIKGDKQKQKFLVSAIPFSRNICDYILKEDDYIFFTSLLHLKPNSDTITIKDLWDKLSSLFNLGILDISVPQTKTVFMFIHDLAEEIVTAGSSGISLEDKIVLSIALRLKTEIFLKGILQANGIKMECDENQTHTWFDRAKNFLTTEQKDLFEKVNLITPESIHVNAFMYEPLIDIPNWKLIELYKKDYL